MRRPKQSDERHVATSSREVANRAKCGEAEQQAAQSIRWSGETDSARMVDDGEA